MEFNSIVQAISQLGFPIAVCLICFWYINKTQELHRQAEEKMAEAINNNTMVIKELMAKLGE